MSRWLISTALLATCFVAPQLLSARPQDPQSDPSASAAHGATPAAAPEKSAGSSARVSSARPTHAEIIAANSVEAARYSNSALGFSFEIPPGMRIESASTVKEIEDAGHRAAHRNDPAGDPLHQQAQAQTIHLLGLVDSRSDRPSSPAQILVLAYDLGADFYSNQEIVAGIAAGMSDGPGEWHVTDAPHERELGGAKVWQEGLVGVVHFGNHSVSVYVQILVTQCRGFALAWNLTAGSQERFDALTKSLGTVQFAAACTATVAPR